ncbi:MAG TPA: hypothetical protein VGA69_02610 [Nitriliruptorales bacterium]
MGGAEELFGLLDGLEASATTVTSVRQPVALRDAVKVAVELGMAANPNEAAVDALRDRLEAFAQHLALEQHFELHPEVRPTLGDLAVVAAELDAHPLAGQERLLRECAAELAELEPGASGQDVLLYAMGKRSVSGVEV